MAPPLSARGIAKPDKHAIAAFHLMAGGEPASDVIETALTPRSTQGAVVASPRPVIRGPQAGAFKEDPVLSAAEEHLANQAFASVDISGAGEVDVESIYTMCGFLNLPLDKDVAKMWLANRSQAKHGLSLDEFKQILARILAGQMPSVRLGMSQKPIRLRDAMLTETTMRKAFGRYKLPRVTTISAEGLRGALKYLSFPDYHGDEFERFVGEWLALEGKEDTAALDFQDFVSCINLLVDFCDRLAEP
mmetsp:Transcript_41394/g.88204  ORF Transcript_41394/g.88204 Transcript_41394/m.88204 type:complete len:247 (-) Transcript_41394:74-814(-)